MPYTVEIHHAARTIVIRGYGVGTTAETLRLIADQQPVFQRHRGYHLLYDSSELQIESSPGDMMEVAGALFDQDEPTFRRIAVVVPQAREGLARIFAALADPHGIETNVFTHRADASNWLGIDEQLAR